MNDKETKTLIESELAMAEAVIHDNTNSKKKLHEATVSYFRGQANACRKLLFSIDRDLPAFQTQKVTLPPYIRQTLIFLLTVSIAMVVLYWFF